jgi:hypothetical protein
MVNFRNHNLVSTDHDTVLQIPVNTTKLIVKFTRVCLVYMPHQNIIFLNWNLILVFTRTYCYIIIRTLFMRIYYLSEMKFLLLHFIVSHFLPTCQS